MLNNTLNGDTGERKNQKGHKIKKKTNNSLEHSIRGKIHPILLPA